MQRFSDGREGARNCDAGATAAKRRVKSLLLASAAGLPAFAVFQPSGAEASPISAAAMVLSIGQATPYYASEFPTTGTNGTANPGTGTPYASFGGANPALNNPWMMNYDSAGDLYIANLGSSGTGAGILKVTPAGAISTFVTGGSGGVLPVGVAVDGAGDVWVQNSNGGNLYEYASNGTIMQSFVVNGGASMNGMAFDSSGNLYLSDVTHTSILKIAAANLGVGQSHLTTTFISGLDSQRGIGFDSSGDLWVADLSGGKVYEFGSSGGTVGTPGSSGEIAALPATSPFSVAFDSSGQLFVADKLSSPSSDYGVELLTPLTSTTDTLSAFIDDGGANTNSAYQTKYMVFVPEPATLSLLAIGAISLLARRRRRVI